MTTDDDLQTTLRWPGETPGAPTSGPGPEGRRPVRTARAEVSAADVGDLASPSDGPADRLREVERGMAALRDDLRDLRQVVLELRELADHAVTRLEQLASSPALRPAAKRGAGERQLSELVHEVTELREELARLRRRVPLRAAPEPGDP